MSELEREQILDDLVTAVGPLQRILSEQVGVLIDPGSLFLGILIARLEDCGMEFEEWFGQADSIKLTKRAISELDKRL